MESKYHMTVNLQVLNHLGLNLYSNTSAVLSEAVANAWDADASNVCISVNDGSIVIADDGCGMSVDDINGKYLAVGYQKRLDGTRTPIHNRLFMGRKGIGKLSLFSIARDIIIYSVKNGEKNALCISTDDLTEAIKSNERYFPKEMDCANVDFDYNGTKIILNKLKKRTSTLSSHLKQRIARRFTVIDGANDFSVRINGENVTLADRNYVSKAQCLWIIPPQDCKDTDAYIQNICSQSDDAKLRNCYVLKDKSQVSDECNISGWFATATVPADLSDDENLNRVSIVVRGKMAKEDVLPELSSTALYTKYLMGEIHADFLDDDACDDITTSNRQNFFEDDERYQAMIGKLKECMQQIRSDWETFRSDEGTVAACKFVVVQDWYDGLKGDEKTSAQKLFGKINQLTIGDEEKRSLFAHGILAFESCKLRHELSALDGIQTDDIDTFLKVAGRLDSIEASMYFEIVTERLAVIKKMQQVATDGSLEKVIQEHLGKNLWLFDPSWDRGTELPNVEIAIKTYFDGIYHNFTEDEKKARFDIVFKKVSSRHIVIELKKGDRVVKRNELHEQITKYAEAMEKALSQSCPDESYEIIVLLGKPLENLDLSSRPYKAFLESVAPYNCRIMYYSELLRNAEVMYKDFLDKNGETATLGNLIERIQKDK